MTAGTPLKSVSMVRCTCPAATSRTCGRPRRRHRNSGGARPALQLCQGAERPRSAADQSRQGTFRSSRARRRSPTLGWRAVAEHPDSAAFAEPPTYKFAAAVLGRLFSAASGLVVSTLWRFINRPSPFAACPLDEAPSAQCIGRSMRETG
jgi:hypothetical protein